ncbi:hybrid sensor histidine kinase/response regulator [Paucibacter sp. KBW04]|uniref:ATP-binding response regulator n=1 Tax=Paucibacter sp. KBW04 TaxID=2153361 RepID=UPI000F577DF7|nr:hybrid sensor histidine kinase/response regulator [Paucibacter sp. KBW04]
MSAKPALDNVPIEEELLSLLARQGKRMPLPVGLSALMIGVIVGKGNTGLVQLFSALWVGLVFASLALRWYVLGRLPHLQHVPVARRLQWAMWLSALSGLLFSLSLVFVPWMSDFERMVQTIILLGLCAGAVASTAGYLPVLLMFLVPVSLANCVAWLGHSGMYEARWLDWALGFLILGFAWVLAFLARDAYSVFVDSVAIRHSQIKSNQQLRLALQQAESAMRSRTRFLASASHDLRQPMHTLSLFGSALVRRPLDPGSAAIVGQMNQALQSLTSQMDALLDISKLDAQVVKVENQVFSLSVWLTRLCQEFQAAAQSKGLNLGLDCPADVFVESDPLLLERVLRNLVDNAIKYTSHGRIDIRVQRAGAETEGLWRLDVQDTGPGIAAPEQAHIFEEFYQIGGERDRAKGLGLGLSIVSRLVDLLDLHLSLASVPGEGTCFSLSIAAVCDPILHAASQSDGAGPQLPHLHVLVLDNEEPVRIAMQALLNSHGCDVTLARSAREAVVKSLQRRPDIVLTDLRLQGGDEGMSAVRSLRGALPGLPAILITGDTAPERLQEASAAGLQVLHKPVLEAQLVAAIKSALLAAN